MENSAAVTAAKAFLDEVWSGEPPALSKLIEVLDRLLASYHEIPLSTAPYHEFEPPEYDWKTTYDQARKRFPTLGLYPIVNPAGDVSDALMMGDAIDDIADITNDLRYAVWYADNHGTNYADANLRQFYFHWGQHARELALLLHMKTAD